MESHMTPSKGFVSRRTADLFAAASLAAIVPGIALAIAPTGARAETKVRGTPQAVVVEAQDASVEEILVALTDTFKVQFRSAANLNKRLTGSYEGTLQQAVSRILKGYDFVVKSGPAALEITLIGAGTPGAVLGARAATKPAEVAEAAAREPPTEVAGSGDQPVPMPRSDGPTTPIRVAQGPAPAPTRPAGAPSPVPQLGPGPVPSPTPPKPGDAPYPVPPLPTTSSAAPPSPMPSTSTPLAPTTSSAPAPSFSTIAPPVPSPTR
jgi:hypothetical protein